MGYSQHPSIRKDTNCMHHQVSSRKVWKWGLLDIMTLRLCWCQAIFKNKEHRFTEVCITRAHSETCIKSKKGKKNQNCCIYVTIHMFFWVKPTFGFVTPIKNESCNAFVQSWWQTIPRNYVDSLCWGIIVHELVSKGQFDTTKYHSGYMYIHLIKLLVIHLCWGFPSQWLTCTIDTRLFHHHYSRFNWYIKMNFVIGRTKLCRLK